MLGEQNAMDVPFNVIGYTAKMIQDQQAQTIADVVRNDAGVRTSKVTAISLKLTAFGGSRSTAMI
jgi:TonB-dependent Receptor Plug Domain.